MKRMIVLVALSLAACSSESGKSANSWDLDDNNGDVGVTDTSPSTNNAPNAGTNGSSNGGTTGNSNGGTTGNSNGGTTGNSNGGTTGNSNGGNVDLGGECTLNSDCAGGRTCCPGLGGPARCEDSCQLGGLCGGSDDECGAGQECCDLSQINQPDICMSQCFGGNNPGTPGGSCTTNADCTTTGEVCCPGIGGAECSADCFGSGGICEQQSDCGNGQQCCDLRLAKVCLDQCSF